MGLPHLEAPGEAARLRADEDSRNNIMVGLIASGEGWHNNPHAEPRSARHATAAGNTTWLTIRFLAWLGLASDVVAPSAHLTARPKGSRLTTRGPTGVPADPDAYS